MDAQKLKALRIDARQKKRPQGAVWIIFLMVIVVSAAATYFAWPRASDNQRVKGTGVKPPPGVTNAVAKSQGFGAGGRAVSGEGGEQPSGAAGEVALTVSGYIINRERIEISPRFLGLVKWIGVKKGDVVTNGQVVCTPG